jgi:hypothetical protein
MGWAALIPVAISVVSSVVSKNSADSQNKSNEQVGYFNTQMKYKTDMNNIASMQAIARYNAGAILAAAGMKTAAEKAVSQRNAAQVLATMNYNDELYQEDIDLLWEATELDMVQLGNQRARERGTMVAVQGASGTVIGEGSNADVVSDQMAQEAMDTLIVKRGAEVKTAQIQNARSQSLWKGYGESQKILWEGEMSAVVNTANAKLQAAGVLAESALQAGAMTTSASNAIVSGNYNAAAGYGTTSSQINNNFTSSLFSAGRAGVQDYYKYKPIASSGGSSGGGSLLTEFGDRTSSPGGSGGV